MNNEKDILNNLPPFYPGQRVVAVDAMPGAHWKNGQVYTISECRQRGTDYWYVGTTCYDNGQAYYRPTIFAPLQSQSFPLLTLSKVIEEQHELVSSN